MTTHFTLYHLPRCPYCLKVRAAAAELGIELSLIDVSRDQASRSRLLRRRGRATVPVLAWQSAGREVLLGESDAIVRHLRAFNPASCAA